LVINKGKNKIFDLSDEVRSKIYRDLTEASTDSGEASFKTPELRPPWGATLEKLGVLLLVRSGFYLTVLPHGRIIHANGSALPPPQINHICDVVASNYAWANGPSITPICCDRIKPRPNPPPLYSNIIRILNYREEVDYGSFILFSGTYCPGKYPSQMGAPAADSFKKKKQRSR
jgi:hypothetical protein